MTVQQQVSFNRFTFYFFVETFKDNVLLHTKNANFSKNTSVSDFLSLLGYPHMDHIW